MRHSIFSLPGCRVSVRNLAGRLKRDTAATIAIIYAVATLPVMGAVGVAIDMSRIRTTTNELQTAADTAALAAVTARVSSNALRVAAADAVYNTNYTGPLTPTVSAVGDASLFTVTATANLPMSIMVAFGMDQVPIQVTARAARIYEGAPPCILALNTALTGAVTITGSANFKALGCVVHSNSGHSTGLVLDSNISPQAAGFCSVGGVRVTTNVQPEPRSYCAVMMDPFAGLALPNSTGCDFNGVEVTPSQTRTLNPGVYCGGLTLKGTVTLNPGTYVVKNGPFTITSQATVTGSDVVFSLTGTNAGFSIDGGGGVTLEGPSTGTYGGMLIMQERNSNKGFENRLAGSSGSRFVGAIYTPTQKVTATGGTDFGENTPFMPIIADTIRISGATTTKIELDGIDLAAPLPSSESGARLVY